MKNIKSSKNNKQENTVQAVERALTLLRLIADSDEPVLLNTLTDITEMNRTTVWRLLVTLENQGFIERDPLTKGYLLGYAASQLAARSSQYDALIRRARPSLEKLEKETNETVLLSVPKHAGTLTIYQINPLHSVRLVDYVNVFLPLHCTSNGKILLSHLPKEELEFILQRPLEKLSPFTITDYQKLIEEVELVRKRGFGTSFGELDESENGISAPIIDKREHLIGFVSVSGPNFRFTEETALGIAPRVISIAEEISNNI